MMFVQVGEAGVHFIMFLGATFNYKAFHHLTALGGIIRSTEHVEPGTPTGQEQMAGSTAASGKE